MPSRPVLLALLTLAVAPAGAAAWVNGGGTLLMSRYR